ncbi:MAG: leucyl aminopeptidase family protein [Sulfuricaulis sp.]|uniref:M17 family metallopeptidase n=1 Tax=Sulfuricaulis sp. TaxID=2003553 RepID=UPI0025F3BDA5|nr:leucyl aminopeptidase family protein [Sulfuricaulis sp.]MCR4348130.1 leucyl aminopeptidase family protein [Sulfuricaulis sp.]
MYSDIPKIRQEANRLAAKTLDIHANAIFLVPAKNADLNALPYGKEIAQRLKRAGHKLDSSKPFVTDLPNPNATRVAIAGIDPASSAFELLTLARQLVAAHKAQKPGSIAVACFGLKPKDAERACEAVLAAILAANFSLPDYKSKPEKPAKLREIHIYGHVAPDDYARTIAEAKGNNLARYLTALPPNELTPGNYRRRVEKLAREYGWKTEFLDIRKLKTRGAGAFLAVAQGSPEPDAGILRLCYAPKKKSSKSALALVGKGICFDTGGTNLKPARHMHGMHEDMEGSAVALGTLLALTELKVDFPIDAWLALAQNHIGPKAYKQNDVVKAANGKTIEVMHTDAEGRMVLADTLYFASREKPKLIVDFATLTGACVGALSTRMSGTLTNREKLVPVLIEAGNASGERVWPFPLPKDYEDALKSDIADIKQCTLDNDADHILAATFLKKFLVNDPDWVHVDLSAGNHKGGLAHIPTDTTGFGVRFTLNLLMDQKVLS